MKLVRIDSDEMKEAVVRYLINGESKSFPAGTGVDRPNFDRALNRVEVVAEIHEQLKELDYERTVCNHCGELRGKSVK